MHYQRWRQHGDPLSSARIPKAVQPIEGDFKLYLQQGGKSARTIENCTQRVRRFLQYVDNDRVERISEDLVKAFFKGLAGGDGNRRGYSLAIGQFLRFAAARLPVVVTDRGSEQRAPGSPPTKQELALRQQWSVDKLIEQKSSADDLIAKLARKVIDAYLLSQQVVKGEYNLDDFVRFTDECRELIETNLPLFMKLSAKGRNIHSAIDERVQK